MSFDQSLDNLIAEAANQENNVVTRETLKSSIQRLIDSESTANDSAIICDNTNNTPERIAAKELWCDVAVRWDGNSNFSYYPGKAAAE